MIQVTIKEAARERGITNPTQLAEIMECAPTIIWKIWTGVHLPKLPMLDRICDALECELEDLVRRRAHKSSPAKRRKAKRNGR